MSDGVEVPGNDDDSLFQVSVGITREGQGFGVGGESGNILNAVKQSIM